jgi:hypothetical protein
MEGGTTIIRSEEDEGGLEYRDKVGGFRTARGSGRIMPEADWRKQTPRTRTIHIEQRRWDESSVTLELIGES